MSNTVKPNQWDRAALYVTILLGGGAAVFTVVQAVRRIIEIVPNKDVPVTAAFADTPATLPIGPDGADVSVIAQTAVFHVSDMPAITLASLLLAAIVHAIAVVIVVVCAILVIRNIIRGDAFARSTVALVGTVTLTVAFGWLLTSLFSTMGANGGAAALAGEASVNTPFVIDPVLLFGVASLGALTAAFTAGGRLQRETEGLV